MLLTDISKNLLVVPAGVFFLSLSKWYVVGDATDSSIGLGIFLSHLGRNTDWHRRDAAGPIKLDMPGANILLSFLDGISRIPSRLRRNATPSNEGQYENAQGFHLTLIALGEVFFGVINDVIRAERPVTIKN